MEIVKFFGFNEYSLTNLGNSTLWFSHIRDFNDPFEGLIKLNKTYSEETFSDRQSAEDMFQIFLDHLKKIKANKLYKHFSMITNIEEKITEMFNYFGGVLPSIYKENVHSNGYCCFSCGDKAYVNQLMWSHYSDGLRGFCLVFDEDKLLQSLVEYNDDDCLIFEPITYTNKLPEINLFHSINDYLGITNITGESLIEYRSTKSAVWGYENEVRAISSSVGLHKYAPESILEVIIGEKMPVDRRMVIYKILKSICPGVSIKIAKIEEDQYQISTYDVPYV